MGEFFSFPLNKRNAVFNSTIRLAWSSPPLLYFLTFWLKKFTDPPPPIPEFFPNPSHRSRYTRRGNDAEAERSFDKYYLY